MYNAFLGFPFNLIIGLALIALLIKIEKEHYFMTFLITALFLSFGFFLPKSSQLYFWISGGASTIIGGSFVAFFLLTYKKLYHESITEPLPDRKTMRDPLVKTQSIQDRQDMYTKMVRDLSKLYLLREKTITSKNTLYIILGISFLFLLNFTTVAGFFMQSDLFQSYLSANFQQLWDNLKFTEKEIQQLITIAQNFMASFTFAQNTFLLLFLYAMVKKMLLYKQKKITAYGSLLFFRLPDIFIWIYIFLAAGMIAFYKTGYDLPWTLIPKNLFYIASFLYVLQTCSTLWLYFQVRLLPGAAIFLSILLMSLIFNSLIVIISIFFLLFGLLEFWFDFRKKALHPKLISNDAV